MSGFPRTTLLLLVALTFLAGATAAQDAPPGAVPMEVQLVPSGASSPRPVTLWDRNGTVYLSAEAAALLLDGTLYWRSELGRMTLSAGNHEVAVVVGSDMALVDGSGLVRMPGDAFLWDGRVLFPLSLLVGEDNRARSWITLPVVWSPEQRRLAASTSEGAITAADLYSDPAGWKLRLEANGPVRYDLERADRSSVIVRFPGVSYDPLLYPLPSAHETFQGLRMRPSGGAVTLQFAPGPRAVGYRITRINPQTIEVWLGVDERDLRLGNLRPLGPASGAVAARVRTLVLDPGHGGSDRGGIFDGTGESALAYELCRRVGDRARAALGIEVILTRRAGEGATPGARAERANRASGDLFLSLHLHERPGGPAGYVAEIERTGVPAPAALATLGFTTFENRQTAYLEVSRLLARFVVDGLNDRIGGREVGLFSEPVPALAAVAMPAALIELGAPGSGRWTDRELDTAADGIVDGIELYVRASGGYR